MARRIADYVATLSREEQERFRDLIQECSAREAQIETSSVEAERALSRLADEQVRLHRSLHELETAGERLRESVTSLYLRLAPAPPRLH